jgi:hypothetical protein
MRAVGFGNCWLVDMGVSKRIAARHSERVEWREEEISMGFYIVVPAIR